MTMKSKANKLLKIMTWPRGLSIYKVIWIFIKQDFSFYFNDFSAEPRTLAQLVIV